MEKKEREEMLLKLLHLKEGGLEDLLLEYAEAVIEDHQEQLEGNGSLTSVPIAERIDSEVLDIIEQLLDKAREEGYEKGWKDGSKGKVFEKIEIETEVKFKDLKDVIEGKEDAGDFLSKLKQ